MLGCERGAVATAVLGGRHGRRRYCADHVEACRLQVLQPKEVVYDRTKK